MDDSSNGMVLRDELRARIRVQLSVTHSAFLDGDNAREVTELRKLLALIEEYTQAKRTREFVQRSLRIA